MGIELDVNTVPGFVRVIITAPGYSPTVVQLNRASARNFVAGLDEAICRAEKHDGNRVDDMGRPLANAASAAIVAGR